MQIIISFLSLLPAARAAGDEGGGSSALRSCGRPQQTMAADRHSLPDVPGERITSPQLPPPSPANSYHFLSRKPLTGTYPSFTDASGGVFAGRGWGTLAPAVALGMMPGGSAREHLHLPPNNLILGTSWVLLTPDFPLVPGRGRSQPKRTPLLRGSVSTSAKKISVHPSPHARAALTNRLSSSTQPGVSKAVTNLWCQS